VGNWGTQTAMTQVHRLWQFAVLAAVFVFCAGARGDTTPVLVEVSLSPQVVDAEALRAAIGKELDCPVVVDREVNHSGEIVIKAASPGQVAVTFVTPERMAPLRRVVALPQMPEHRVQLIAWLVGNMARNEAAEWLAAHEREKQAEQGISAATDSTNATTVEPKADAKPDNKPEEKVAADLTVGNAANKNSTNNDATGKKAAVEPPPAQAGEGGAGSSSQALRFHGVNLALWHRVLELHRDSETSRFALHLGLGYGRVGAIRGFGFDLLHHRVDTEVQGAATSLGWTRVGRTQGLAWSFGVVTAEHDLRGLDYAGLVSYREGAIAGVQGAGLAVYSTGDVLGAQLAGVFAWTEGNITGVQGAFIFTRQDGLLRGLQASFVANLADDVTGMQLGAINVAKDVHGIQVGLINVAQSVDGMAIGIVNIAHNVRTQALGWVERNYGQNIGVRYDYSPMTFGVSSGYDAADDRERFLFGLGARFPYKRFAFAPSLDVGFVIDKARANPVARGHENDVRLAVEWEIVPKIIGIFAGPALALRSDASDKLQPLPRWFAGLTLF
jgi:hypothetical protein